MTATELSPQDLLSKLSKYPDNNELLDEFIERFSDPSVDDELAEAIYSTTGIFRPNWVNCIGEQKCRPKHIYYPTSIRKLADAIKKAKKENLSVLDLDTSVLRNPLVASTLFSVESGITIKRLNNELDKRTKALINMGAYDGQTLAGAISTGTHGTGITLGPMASSVRSLVLVSEFGTTYQIEPSNGITDPEKFQKLQPGVTLVQDDDWFQSNVIAMGCMGLIYSYTLEVEQAYNLTEKRTLETWEALKDLGVIPQLLRSWRHFEIDINPYAVDNVHSCIKIVREKTDHSRRGWRGIPSFIAGLLASSRLAEMFLVAAINKWPTSCPGIINRALKVLVDDNYIDKSYKVMDLGAVDNVKALALELSLDATDATVDASALIKQVDKILDVFAKAAAEKKWYMAGPVALRFVAASDAYLAPQQGRTTCMVELDLLVGINNGDELLKEVRNVMCTPGSGVRVHWGLDLDTVTGKDMHDMFPMFDRWLGVYQKLNSTGIFSSPFTDRLGISVKKS
ncbi:MAG: hypothetical protein MMC33_009024 [Icmadophila ericetorum]|nr:hypothetical protein [Icmadophila ericetorum]